MISMRTLDAPMLFVAVLTVVAALLLADAPANPHVLSAAVKNADGDAAAPVRMAQGVSPRVTIDSQGRVFVVYGRTDSNRKGGVYLRVSEDRGATFGDEVRVSEFEWIPMGMGRGPRIAVGENGIVVTAVGRLRANETARNLYAWHSRDNGRTWRGPVTINRVQDSARECMHDVTVSPSDGRFFVVWLDLRNTSGTEVWAAASRDGQRWDRDGQIYRAPGGTVCQCCDPAVAYDPSGRLHVAFRNVVGANRDIYWMSSTDHGRRWSTAEKVGNGSWAVESCPMAPPTFVFPRTAVAEGEETQATTQTLTLWNRGDVVYQCEPGQAEQRVGDGHWPAAAAAGDGGLHTLWMAGQRFRPGSIRYRNPAGEARTVARDARMPHVAAGRGEFAGLVIGAWDTAAGDIEVVRLAQ